MDTPDLNESPFARYHCQQDRMLVVPDPEVKKVGGLHLPQGAKLDSTRVTFGKVVAVGPGRTDGSYPNGIRPTNCRVGDYVGYFKGSGHMICLDHKAYHMIGNDDVMIVVDSGVKTSQYFYTESS